MRSAVFFSNVASGLAAYALGCLCTGYYLTRLKTGQDIRRTGSRNVGAKNVGRMLGRRGFAITLTGDVVKGAAAIGIARLIVPGPWGVSLALVGVVLGHMCPVQLGFRGGKGVATLLGAMLALDWRLILALGVIWALTAAVTRKFTVSGLAALALSPAASLLLEEPKPVLWSVALAAFLVLLSHRKNILQAIRPREPAADPPPP